MTEKYLIELVKHLTQILKSLPKIIKLHFEKIVYSDCSETLVVFFLEKIDK